MTTQSLIGVSYETLSAEIAVSQTLVGEHVEVLGAGAPTQTLVGEHVETAMKAANVQKLVAFYVEVLAPYTPGARKIRTGFLSARIRGA